MDNRALCEFQTRFMTASTQDLTTTRFVFPPDAKLLSVDELAPRLRAKIGPVDGSNVVVTRPGFRVTTRLVSDSLAALLGEFRSACLLTDAIARFSHLHKQNAADILELSFDALATLIEGRILVAADSPDVSATEPSLAAGQAVANMEIVHLVRALDDTEVYRARMADGASAALKIARDDRAEKMLAHETRLLEKLSGDITPRLLAKGHHEGRIWLAMEWCSGVPIAIAAQQLRASGDRARLHKLVTDLLKAYAQLHDRGIIHGDIHPSNILAADNGVLTIVDLGRSALIAEASEQGTSRAGIAHFYDPQMATALLAGLVPPAPSILAEQYALGVLAYLLLTGLYPVEPAAEHGDLLTRIVTRPPLPFAARGVDAAPQVERVLHQALAKKEAARFASIADFARAMREVRVPRRRQVRRYPYVEQLIQMLANGEIIAGCNSTELAWIALRAAQARSDAQLLASASFYASKSEKSLQSYAVAAHVAFAQSDRRAALGASQEFITAAEKLPDDESCCLALLEAATLLENAISFKLDPVKDWAAKRLNQLWMKGAKTAGLIHSALALVRTGTVALPDGAYKHLDQLKNGSAWLWGDAFDHWQQETHLERACTAKLPRDALSRGMTLLRLHRLTGEVSWVARARRVATSSLQKAANPSGALLAIELEMPFCRSEFIRDRIRDRNRE